MGVVVKEDLSTPIGVGKVLCEGDTPDLDLHTNAHLSASCTIKIANK